MPILQEALDEVKELSGVMTMGDDYLPADVQAECERIIPEVHEVKPENATDTYKNTKKRANFNIFRHASYSRDTQV